jgi:hypothetical protein
MLSWNSENYWESYADEMLEKEDDWFDQWIKEIQAEKDSIKGEL